MEYYLIALIVIAVMSVITFITYAIDKRRAIESKWRVPERILITMSLLGGGIGGMIAMVTCHHKTRKLGFRIANILGIAIDIVVVVVLYTMI